MQIIDRTNASTEVKLEHAILIYRGHTTACATLHPVLLEQSGAASLGAGTPFDLETLQSIALNISGSQDSGFLPPTILAYNLNRMIWFCPAKCRTIWFRSNDMEKIGALNGADCVHPNLVFKATVGGSLSVWAVPSDRAGKPVRPTPDTPLYQAPFYNVYNTGVICMGTANKPGLILPSQIPEFEKGFFESAGSHANAGKLTRHPKGFAAFWKSMKKLKSVPNKWLVKTKAKVGDII